MPKAGTNSDCGAFCRQWLRRSSYRLDLKWKASSSGVLCSVAINNQVQTALNFDRSKRMPLLVFCLSTARCFESLIRPPVDLNAIEPAPMIKMPALTATSISVMLKPELFPLSFLRLEIENKEWWFMAFHICKFSLHHGWSIDNDCESLMVLRWEAGESSNDIV